MKGFLFLLGGKKVKDPTEKVRAAISKGEFTPRVSRSPQVYGAVLADLMSARPGDRVFFFTQRGIYGSARIVGLPNQRLGGSWVNTKGDISVYLEPCPRLLRQPVDMDELLLRPGNEVAAGIRTMGGKSFFLLDPDETRWLEEQFYRRLSSDEEFTFPDGLKALEAAKRAGRALPLRLAVPQLRARLPAPGKRFTSESLLHAAIIERLREQPKILVGPEPKHRLRLVSLHHEYLASPAKQADYVDSIDIVRVFGPNVDSHRRVATFYDCWEVKKGSLSPAKFRSLLIQGMKYVDFIASSRLGGDFSRVRLNLVAARFPESAVRERETADAAVRHYVRGTREAARSEKWTEIALWVYSWDGKTVSLKQQ